MHGLRTERTRPNSEGLPRSYLYVPGDRVEYLRGARRRGADAVIVDLEDAVALSRKDDARRLVREWLGEQKAGEDQLWLRINPGEASEDVAVTTPTISGVVAAKASLEVLAEVDDALAQRERDLDVPQGFFQVTALIESARGLTEVDAIATSSRVSRLGFGEADLSAELGIVSSDSVTSLEMLPLRMRLVLASASAGIPGPIGSVSTDVRDLRALRESTVTLFRLGFRARTAIHPGQVADINEVFTPSAEQVRWARRLVEGYEAALERGSGVIVDDRGVMVDRAVIRSAEEVLRRSRS